nr:immunoglobulin heavy chain junction region [Mus musculus]MBK4186712.1 immunoglobulin heavy chain junction region [Mus musculus]
CARGDGYPLFDYW